mgnify:CR=1 FL=1
MNHLKVGNFVLTEIYCQVAAITLLDTGKGIEEFALLVPVRPDGSIDSEGNSWSIDSWRRTTKLERFIPPKEQPGSSIK